jgi:hypothetical protein
MASDKSHSEKIIFDGIINMGKFLRQQKWNPQIFLLEKSIIAQCGRVDNPT